MKKMIFAILFFAVSGAAFGKNSEAEELVYTALKYEGAKRAAMLIEAAKMTPENPLLAVNLLGNTPLPGRELADTVKKYDELWQKYPHQSDIVWCGMKLSARMRNRVGNVLENLKKSNNYSCNCPKSERKAEEIRRLRLALHMVYGDTQDGLKFAATLEPDRFCYQLAEFYYTCAFRARVAGSDDEAEILHGKYKKMLEIAAANMAADRNVPVWKSAEKITYLFKRGMNEYAEAIYKMMISEISSQEERDVVREHYVLSTTDFARAQEEIAKIEHIKTPEQKLPFLFEAAINAKKWDLCKELVKKFPPTLQKLRRRELSYVMYDGKAIAELANDKTLKLQDRAMGKFIAASILKDEKLYREGRELMKNCSLQVAEYNTAAYTASEFGVDLDWAYSVLKRVISAEPENASYLDSMAYVCFRKGLYAQADKYIKRALELVTSDLPAAVIIEHAADIAAAQGDFYRAGTLYKRALKFGKDDMSFDFKAVKNKLEKLK